MIEIDEPLALQIGDDASEWRAFSGRARSALTGGHRRRSDGPHLSLGLWGGEIDRAGHAALLDAPYLSYLVDVLAGPSAWRFIASVPPERGIIAGSADATTESHAMRPRSTSGRWPGRRRAIAARARRAARRTGRSAQIGRHFAHRKCGRLGEAVQIAAMGPLQDVAEALDEHPEASRMPELRALAEAVAGAARQLMPLAP